LESNLDPYGSKPRYLLVAALFVEAGGELISSDLLQPTKNAAVINTQNSSFFIPKSLLIKYRSSLTAALTMREEATDGQSG
jgi:hypothetical protein